MQVPITCLIKVLIEVWYCFVLFFLMVPNTIIIITRWKKVKKQKKSSFHCFLFICIFDFWSQWVKIDKSGWFDYNDRCLFGSVRGERGGERERVF